MKPSRIRGHHTWYLALGIARSQARPDGEAYGGIPPHVALEAAREAHPGWEPRFSDVLKFHYPSRALASVTISRAKFAWFQNYFH